MTARSAENATRWIYEGIWAVLVEWFRVPRQPPKLPAAEGEWIESFRPSEGFLRKLKLQFWIVLVAIDIAIFVAWLVVLFVIPWLGLLLAIPALLIAVVPDIIAYVAIHLRYDTTWYVMSDRSLRIRRGIWIVHETTITFENVQNVNLLQGPLEQCFGIANLAVETAGGGASHDAKSGQAASSHRGLIEGVSDAARIRDLILARVRRSRAAGLGDDALHELRELVPSANHTVWSTEHVAALREIRDAARAFAS